MRFNSSQMIERKHLICVMWTTMILGIVMGSATKLTRICQLLTTISLLENLISLYLCRKRVGRVQQLPQRHILLCLTTTSNPPNQRLD
jgi:uncharacterized protein YhhL (DUF1145 family)